MSNGARVGIAGDGVLAEMRIAPASLAGRVTWSFAAPPLRLAMRGLFVAAIFHLREQHPASGRADGKQSRTW